MNASAVRHSMACACVVITLGVQISMTAQTPSPADGPWSGQAQCVLSTRSADYQEEQTHTWRITGGPPRLSGAFRQWPAVWSVQGSGQRVMASPSLRREAMTSERWTLSVPETSAPIAVWDIPATGRVRFGSQHGLLESSGAVTVTSSTGQRASYSLQEWEFPATEDAATLTTISGTRTRTIPGGPSWRKPADVPTTETCTWNFVRGNAPAALRLSQSTQSPGGADGTIAGGAPTPGAPETSATPVATALLPSLFPTPTAPPPPSETAAPTAPLGPAPVATVHTTTFTSPSGGHMSELWSSGSTQAYMVMSLQRATVQPDGTIYAEAISVGNILPGRYGTTLSLQCPAGRSLSFTLVASAASGVLTLKTWTEPASQKSAYSLEHTFDLPAARSGLMWTVPGGCAFVNLVIWSPA